MAGRRVAGGEFRHLHRLFQERGLPLTIFGCVLALEQNPEARAAGYDTCAHGWRWVKHFELDEAEEREHIARAVAGIERTTGATHPYPRAGC